MFGKRNEIKEEGTSIVFYINTDEKCHVVVCPLRPECLLSFVLSPLEIVPQCQVDHKMGSGEEHEK